MEITDLYIVNSTICICVDVFVSIRYAVYCANHNSQFIISFRTGATDTHKKICAYLHNLSLLLEQEQVIHKKYEISQVDPFLQHR